MNNKKIKKIIEICFIICLICFISILVCLVIELISNSSNVNTIISLCASLFCLIALEIAQINIGYYECPNCKNKVSLKFHDYILGYRTFNKAKLKCPHCNTKVICNKIVK